MTIVIEHTGQHLAQLHGEQLAGGCVACHAYLSTQAETDAPEVDTDPAERDPEEAEPGIELDACPLHGAGCEAWS